MLTTLTREALARPLLTLLGCLLLAVSGALAWRALPIDAFPDISAPQVKVIVKVPGLTPEELEARVTVPLETELLGLPRQTQLRSVTKFGLADITLDFRDGTDLYWARAQVAERLNAVWADLPAGAEGGLAPLTTPLGEMFMFTVEGPQPLAERKAVLERLIRPALRTVPGVADVNVLGGRTATFDVAADPWQLAASGLSLDDLRRALRSAGLNDGAGRIQEGEEALPVRFEGAVDSLEALRALPVAQRGGSLIRLGDVATVAPGSLPRQGGVTRDGQSETVQGLVLGLRGADAAQVVRAVRAQLEALAPRLPAGMEIHPFYDRGELVRHAVGTVEKALLEAGVLVLVMLWLFLGSVRAAVAVAVILPFSALWTFSAMQLLGMSANLMSLGGLAIAIGLLVDAAVVVVENVEQRLREAPSGTCPPRQRILEACREVALPLGAGMLIIGLVFVPLLSLEGLEGKLFRPVAVTIVCALAGSLFLSLTLIPWACHLLLDQRNTPHEPWLPRQLQRGYRPVLEAALRAPKTVLLIVLALLLAAGGLYLRIGKTFMPTMDEGSLIVQLEKLPSVALDASLELDLAVQRALLDQLPEIRSIVARTGSDEIGLDPMGLNQTDAFLVLAPPEAWRMPDKEALQDAIRAVLDGFPGIAYGFNQPIQMRVSEMIFGVRGDLAVRVYGPDLEVLERKAETIAELLRGIPGAEDVFRSASEGAPVLRFVPDRESLVAAGLDAEALNSALKAHVEGESLGQIIDAEGRRIPLRLRAFQQSPDRLSLAAAPMPEAAPRTLGELGRLERRDGPVQIQREAGSRHTVVLANVRGRDLVSFVAEARQVLESRLELPPGYRLAYSGEFENQQRAAQRLSLVIPASLGLILLILYAVLGSLPKALLILVNVPLATFGGVMALSVAGLYLSVPASVGFIALMGIAVLNGLVLLTQFEQLSRAGLPLEQVVRQGALRRLRPVLLTATMAAIGLIPFLFASGPGSEIQRPLAVVVIGGLISSTLLTLVVLPVLYRWLGSVSPRAVS